MIKKINKYLLENHSLVWNTRLIWMLAVLLGMHILFFIIGFMSYLSPVDLHETDLFFMYFESGFVWIGVLLSILILLLWMNQYFKHNAFKAQYPKSNFSIYKEFLIVFLIAFLAVTQYFSYTQGLKMRISSIKTTEEVEKGIDLVNRTAPFTLQNKYSGGDGYYTPSPYTQINRCVNVSVFDSLVSQDDVLRLFVANQFKNKIWGLTPDDTLNYQKFKDSLQYPLYKNQEFETVLVRHFPQREDWKAPEDYKTQEVYISELGDYSEAVITEDETVATADGVYYGSNGNETYLNYNLNSIYNYCQVVTYSSDSLKNGEYYAKKTYGLLQNKKKDSIQYLMNNYLKLADEYQVGYRFKDKNWIEYVDNPPYYFVDYELSSVSRYSEAHQKQFKKDYIAEEDMVTTLNNLKKSKTSVFQSFEYLICLYIALGIALLIFTFRFTAMRTWIISVVGSLVVYFIFFSLFFLLGMLVFDMSEVYAMILCLIFILVFWLLAWAIFTKSRKLVSGVNFIWSIWSFGAILPICVGLYSDYLEWKFPYHYLTNKTEHPHVEWIRTNFDLIMFINFILIFVFILLILPVIKKWKSMPEE